MRRLAAILFTDLVGYTATMGADETRAIGLVKRSRELVTGLVAASGGRCREFEGDGTLSTFSSAVDAVSCARSIRDRFIEERGLAVRIGLHVGDVVEEDGAIFGDGVNVAARILSLAEPGGVCVSSAVYDQVRNQEGISARSLGPVQLKNVNRPIEVYALWAGDAYPPRLPRRSRKLLVVAGVVALLVSATVASGAHLAAAAWVLHELIRRQAPLDVEVRMARAADGARIAWAEIGAGPPVLQVQAWGTNAGRPIPTWVGALAPEHRYVWYDGRGFGLSDKGLEHSLDGQVLDIETVADAAGLERFSILAISGGVPAAIAYAARHPDRMDRMVLYGARVGPIPGSATRRGLDRDSWVAMIELVRRHWGTPHETFRQLFVSHFLPDGSSLEHRLFERFMFDGDGNEVARFLTAALDTDVREEAAAIEMPVLLLHRRDDRVIPYEGALEAAARIEASRLVTLEGQNHIFLPGDEEGERALAEAAAFLRR